MSTHHLLESNRDAEPFNPDGGNETTIEPMSWVEEVPLEYRKKRGAIAIAIGAILSVLVGYFIFKYSKEVGVFSIAVILSPTGIGLLRWNVWIQKCSIQRFATESIELSRRERLINAGRWWLVGIGVSVIYSAAMPKEYWWLPLALCTPFLIIGLVIFFSRTSLVMTADAQAFHDSMKVEQEHKEALIRANQDEKSKIFFNKPLVRYPLAALFVWFAYVVGSSPKGDVLTVLGILGVAAMFARELSKWILWIALSIAVIWLVISGIAMLPVSVAVIIGALIIADAIKR